LRASETAALALAREVIVTSPATSSILVQEFGVAPRRLTVALPGTDPAPRSCGTGSPLQLLAVGSIVPRKGYDVLVRALETIGDQEWHLNIAGAGDRSPGTAAELRALILASGLDHRITLNGTVSDERLAELYAKADVFVMSSLFEGFGMVLAEAMARGLPIVSTTGGAAAETVPDAAAIKVPPGDVAALAEALRTVMRDAVLRTEMANASWRAGRALPQWKDTARIIADVIRKAST
jgi:glycosyltransferase involved in cell wall biosynthesis